MPAAWLGRMLDWLRGDRPQPRFLTPFIDIHYEGEDTSPEHDQFTLAEEIADACAISHNLVYDALPLVADFLDWISWCDRTHDAHLQGYRKSEKPDYPPFPMELGSDRGEAGDPGEEQKPTESPFSADSVAHEPNPSQEPEPEPEPEPAADEKGDSVHELEQGSIVTVSQGDVVSNTFESETREQAIARLQQEMHKNLQRLKQADADCDADKQGLKESTAWLKSCQARLNATISELDEAVSDGDWQAHLPFDATSPEEPGVPVVCQSKAARPVDPAKNVSVEDLDLPAKLQEKLLAADVELITEVEMRISSGPVLNKIKGIGPAAVDQITDALLTWRNEHGYKPDPEDGDDPNDVELVSEKPDVPETPETVAPPPTEHAITERVPEAEDRQLRAEDGTALEAPDDRPCDFSERRPDYCKVHHRHDCPGGG